jgi:hypothetical protein
MNNIPTTTVTTSKNVMSQVDNNVMGNSFLNTPTKLSHISNSNNNTSITNNNRAIVEMLPHSRATLDTLCELEMIPFGFPLNLTTYIILPDPALFDARSREITHLIDEISKHEEIYGRDDDDDDDDNDGDDQEEEEKDDDDDDDVDDDDNNDDNNDDDSNENNNKTTAMIMAKWIIIVMTATITVLTLYSTVSSKLHFRISESWK